MAAHHHECKIAVFISTLPDNISQLTSQFLIIGSAVLRHSAGFHLMVFDNWKTGRNSEKDDEEAVAYEDLHKLGKHFANILYAMLTLLGVRLH